ncbi:ABC transporter substrate-binding protein [Halobaculum magnesiiphilum]|uniref:ABC transporter substrate-binding protein n=1 Tax=Halobaculum magnesiiphilum TaxID=1017351 RepID=A0A8T8WIX9_9EURY|nr:ABC transporter substrate-binding protein [Halobaculum magnesiiphilum]QZP39788.1 ABC transporter substrate-binding protein [Halobaculum magnesiiphilum]
MAGEIPRTRRDVLGGAVIGAGLLAGCAGRSSDGSETAADTETTTDEPTATPEPGYSVTMEPAGTVEFDAVPERWVPFTGVYADMGVALGQADGLAGIGVPGRYGAHLYEELPGVSVDTDELTALYQDGTGKEIFYEIDADVHVIDPNFMTNRLGWSRSDVDEVAENVAPFVGNTTFTRVYDWHDYPHYSMYEAFGKLAEVFHERERYEAFRDYHDEILADVRDRLPADTPDVALLYPAEIPPEGFYPYLEGEGTTSKHWRDLQVGDALAAAGVDDAQAGGGVLDFETLLEIDPDALAIRIQGEITEEYFDENVRSYLENHEVASELTAVENDRVIYGGLTYQGPIINLFQLEQAAQGLYPDEFGGEELFDRERVANIVTGEFGDA